MRIVYDEKKNARNVELRGLPFDHVFDADWPYAIVREDMRKAYTEKRFVALVPIGFRLHVVCFTYQGDAMRVISFRKANKREMKKYEEEIHASGGSSRC